MKKGIFIKGKLTGYNQLEFKNPTREIKGKKFKADDGLEVYVWNAIYKFNGDGTVTTIPHTQIQ